MDVVELIGRLQFGYLSRSRIPRELEPVMHRGDEVQPRDVRSTRKAVEAVWQRAEALYRTGTQPGFQLCIRRHGSVVLNRSIGHARGNAPNDPRDAPKLDMTTETPVNIFSAAKAVTAMLLHKLDEQNVLDLDDRVCEFIPEFARHGKDRATIRHVLAHRAGIPNLPPDSMDLDLLTHPETVIQIARTRTNSAPLRRNSASGRLQKRRPDFPISETRFP